MPDDRDGRHDLVVIGASAGGVETLRKVVAGFRTDMPASICIVLHIAPGSPSALAKILQRSGPLPCRPARDGDRLRPGQILVAPPDHHLVIEDNRVRLTLGPRENGHRPAIDVLFRSAAAAMNSRVVGVVLSGTRDDGSVGLAVIKSSGGATIVQDPREALYPGMPASALRHVVVDAVVPSESVAATIDAMVRGQQEQTEALPSVINPGNRPYAGEGVSTVCPECGGVLSERSEAGVTQWECRVGHRYSPDSLTDAQAEGVEAAMWATIRILEDRERLMERIASQLEAGHQPRTARSFRSRAEGAREQAATVRGALESAAVTTLRRIVDGDGEHHGDEDDDH